jgi:O-antigen/teichoic acid export membrane protein
VTSSPPLQEDLRSRVVRGLGWKAFSQLAGQAMALVTTIVIAHLLTPAEVGVVAMATVFSGLALVLGDTALDAALIQRRTLTEDDRSTAFWLNVGVGLCLTVAGIALAGPIASLYGEPEVEPLFKVISLTFILTTLGSAQGALLIREMHFRSLEVRTVIASAVASAVAIVLAILGAGPWAIVGQLLTVAGVSTVLLWRASTWRPRFVFSRQSLRQLTGFSGWIVGSRLLAYLKGNTDNYLVGRYAGSAALGAYSIAYNVMLVPLTRLLQPAEQVFFPALAEIREPARVGATFLRTTTMAALVTVPAFAGMAVVAPDFVAVVLGDQWDEAVPILRILCWVGILQALAWQTVNVLQVLERTALAFRYAVVATPLTIAAFAVGVQWGAVGVAVGFAVATTVLTPWYLAMPLRLTGIGARRFLGAISGVLEASAAMAAVLLALWLFAFESMSPAPRLAILVAVGACVYVPLVAWRVPEAVQELRSLWARRRLSQQPAEDVRLESP